MDWTYYKDLGAWPFRFQQDRPHYNEGNRISSSDNPVWTTDFTGRSVTPTHAPWCGYWHDEPVGDYDKGLEFPPGPGYDLDPCVKDPGIAWDYDNSGSVGAPYSSVEVAITGLNTPFIWEVSGTGFSLSRIKTDGLTNTLNISGAGCGSATIIVTGCDGEQTVGYVRSLIGIWGPIIDGCKLTGDWDTHLSTCGFEKILGKYFQYQKIYPAPDGIHHCGEDSCSAFCPICGVSLISCLTISCADYGWGGHFACSSSCCGNPCNSGKCWMANDEPCQDLTDCPNDTACSKVANCKCTHYVKYQEWGCP